MPNVLGKDGDNNDVYLHSTKENTDTDPLDSHETVADAVETSQTAITTAIGGFQTAIANILGNIQNIVTSIQNMLVDMRSGDTNSIAHLTAVLQLKTSVESTVSVGTSLTPLLTQTLSWVDDRLIVELSNTGSVDFNSFEIQHRVHPNSSYEAVENANADFANPLPSGVNARITWVNGQNPFTLAAGETSRFELTRVGGWYDVRFAASVATGTTDVVTRMGGGR
ncbi:MAG: hypothetical protein AAF959_02105 [Cyanobacteria bacterium P01_D01_bin.56]